MYICLDCNTRFWTPKQFTETHGLDSPPYEAWWGCPRCGGAYLKTMPCSECGQWITGEYIQLKDHTVVCENCYEIKDIEDME